MTEKADLFAALAKAQQAARAVEKSKKVTFGGGYKYASGEDVIEEARHALEGFGLAFTAVSYRVDSREHGLVLMARYLLTHSSGESLEVESETPIIPDKGRPEDKATATAKTYDLSYQLRGLLLLARVDEGAEVDARDDTKYQPKNRQTQPNGWPAARAQWIKVFGRTLFAELVGVELSEVDSYEPPKDPKERAAVKAVLEAARRDLDTSSGVAS